MTSDFADSVAIEILNLVADKCSTGGYFLLLSAAAHLNGDHWHGPEGSTAAHFIGDPARQVAKQRQKVASPLAQSLIGEDIQ